MKDGWRETTNDDHVLFFVFFSLFTPSFFFSQWEVGAIVLFFSWKLFHHLTTFIWPGRAESAAREKEREERVSKEYLNMILQILYFLFLHLKLFQLFHPGETDQRGTGGGKKTQIGRAQTTCKFFYAILVNQSILLLNLVHLGFVKVVTASTPKYQVLTTFLNGQAQQAETNNKSWQLFRLSKHRSSGSSKRRWDGDTLTSWGAKTWTEGRRFVNFLKYIFKDKD